MEKGRKPVDHQSAVLTPPSRAEDIRTSTDDSNSPSHSSGQDRSAAERERQRLREQERRRREAVSYSLFTLFHSPLNQKRRLHYFFYIYFILK